MSRKALRRSAGKALSVDIYERRDHRYHVVWKDETGKRCFASRGSLAEAKTFQTQKIAELERHREGRFNLDDREMLSQARDLASRHGYTVLQALQEWHRAKGSTNGQPLGEAIEKFLAAKASRSAAYTDKLKADMRQVGHISALTGQSTEFSLKKSRTSWTRKKQLAGGAIICAPK